ncbi:MAG: monooxygenase [Gammaproteobacteria bacterium]
MATLLQFDFPFAGPFGEDLAQTLTELAHAINDEPGFLWKIWTEDAAERSAGGIYLFADRPSAEAYVAKHTERLAGFGVSGIRARVFDVNETLSAINHGPLV